jgi:branched-chain amino acid transport system substrate-binding protein
VLVPVEENMIGVKTMNWNSILKAALFASIAVIVAQPAMAQQKPPIKVGAILPITGFVATVGAYFRTAIEIGVEDINKAGGVNGSPISLAVEDDKLDPAQSVLLFRKLSADNTMAVMGPISSSSWENVAPLAPRMKLPALNFTTLKKEIANNEWTVRIHPHEGTMIPEALRDFVKMYPNAKKVVIAGDVKEASSEAAMKEFAKAAKTYGLEVLDTIEFQTRMTDFSQIAIKVRGLKPDALLTGGIVVTILPMVKELRSQGIDIPILNNAMIWGSSFPNMIGEAGAKFYTFGFSTNEDVADNPKHNEFIRRFKEKLKGQSSIPQPPNPANAILGYEGILVLADLMTRKKIDGSTDVAKARDLIKEGFGELKVAKGIYTIQMDKDRNGYLPARLMSLNLGTKEWNYALPPGR